MPTISAGSSQTFTAGVKDQLFTLTANGGALGTVTGAATASFGPGAERRSFGPFAVGQAITVTVLAGSVIVEYGDATPDNEGAAASSLTGGQVATGASGVMGVAPNGKSINPDGLVSVASKSFLGARNITGTGQSAFSTAGADYTWSLCIALPVGFHAVRPICGNTLSAAITGCTAAASVGGTGSDLLNNSGTWTTATWAGAASGSIPGGGTTAAPVFSTPTDWINIEDTPRVDGGTLKLVYLRMMTPLANASVPLIGPGASFNWDAPSDGWIFSHRFQSGNYVASPSGMTGSSNPFGAPICGVQFLAETEVKTILFIGDSITHGSSASPLMNSFAHQATVLVSTSTNPAVCANFGANSRNSTEIATRADSLIPLIKPSYVVMPAGSPNDGTPTAANIGARKAAHRRVATVAAANNVRRLVIWDELPRTTDATNATSSYNVAQDLLRKQNNRDNTIGVVKVSMNTLQDTDSDAVASKWVSAAATADGLHPSAAGHALMAIPVAAAIGD
jgi:lysophospholipase L1-like esterase